LLKTECSTFLKARLRRANPPENGGTLFQKNPIKRVKKSVPLFNKPLFYKSFDTTPPGTIFLSTQSEICRVTLKLTLGAVGTIVETTG
jgi:hypothetical protein